jgi:hypothetical protein
VVGEVYPSKVCLEDEAVLLAAVETDMLADLPEILGSVDSIYDEVGTDVEVAIDVDGELGLLASSLLMLDGSSSDDRSAWATSRFS